MKLSLNPIVLAIGKQSPVAHDQINQGRERMIKQATKKPVTIDFVEWTGKNLLEVIRFTGQHASAMDYKWGEYEDLVRDKGLKIFTLEGSHMATIGDMIIKGIAGEHYPCKPDIFHKTYNIKPSF